MCKSHGQEAETPSAVKSKFVMENDPAKQQKRLEDTYSDVKENNRGVTIPDEVLNRYKSIRSSPETKLIAAVKGYYNNNLKGQKVDVAVKNGIIAVVFENDGRNKSVGWRMTPEKAATFEYLKPLLEKSTYAYSEENRVEKKRVDVPIFHYFVSNANIGGADIPIKIQIRELNLLTGTENRYYTHNFIKGTGNDGPVYGTNPDRVHADRRNARTFPDTDKITDFATKVKSGVKNISEPP